MTKYFLAITTCAILSGFSVPALASINVEGTAAPGARSDFLGADDGPRPGRGLVFDRAEALPNSNVEGQHRFASPFDANRRYRLNGAEIASQSITHALAPTDENNVAPDEVGGIGAKVEMMGVATEAENRDRGTERVARLAGRYPIRRGDGEGGGEQAA